VAAVTTRHITQPVVLVVACLLATATISAWQSLSQTMDVDKELGNVQFASDMAAAEAAGSRLLAHYTNSAAVTGRIYLALALNNAYRWGGLELIVANAERALRYPLAPNDACRAYLTIAGALQVRVTRGVTPQQEGDARRRALNCCLKCISIVSPNGTPPAKQELPLVPMLTYVGDTNNVAYRELVMRRDADRARRDEADAANQSALLYKQATGHIKGLYRGLPCEGDIVTEGSKCAVARNVLETLIAEVKADSAAALNGREAESR
jgi:hypothetical protein